MINNATLTRNILSVYRSAPHAREDGSSWYDNARAEVDRLADLSGYSPERVAIAVAHLSPRTPWSKNLAYARALVLGWGKPSGAMGRSWDAATRALHAEDPWSTFGKRAPKTRAFAHAILGDPDAVVVDVWAARVAGVDVDSLSRAGEYDRVADAYRRAAKRVGLTPRELQATTWVAARGKAA